MRPSNLSSLEIFDSYCTPTLTTLLPTKSPLQGLCIKAGPHWLPRMESYHDIVHLPYSIFA